MTRTLLLLVPLFWAAISSATSLSAASLYLHPAATGKGRVSEISAIEANQILAHLLDVPGETLGAGANQRDVWNWVQPSEQGKKTVENLFDDSTQRGVILFTDLSEEDAKDVIPSQIRHTHRIVSPPHVSSFEALLHHYGEQIYSAVPALGEQFGGFLTSTMEGVEVALEGATNWLAGSSSSSLQSWKKTVDEVDFSGEASATFYKSIKDLLAFFDAREHDDDDSVQGASYRAVRFNGLNEIKATYGQESNEFKQAKQTLHSLLEAAVTQLDSLAKNRPQKLAFIVLPEQERTLLPRSIDLLSPFRSTLSLTPFITTRDESLVFKNNTKAPKESDFIGKCFTAEDDLTKATANCSGHGKAVQSSKGGRKCYRCKCQSTKGKNGKTIDWAGAACQKEDLSKPFVLLLTTSIGLMFVIFSSILYLFYEGQQELPSVLSGLSK